MLHGDDTPTDGDDTPTESVEDALKREEEEEEREEKRAAQQARLAGVLIDGDTDVRGKAALARLTPWTRQRFTYALENYPELEFIRQGVGPKPISMVSSMQNIDYGAIEARILEEQRQRGALRGKQNRRQRAGQTHETLVSEAHLNARAGKVFKITGKD